MAKKEQPLQSRRSLSERLTHHDAFFNAPEERRAVHFFYPRLEEIRPNQRNARRTFDPDRLAELADSIKLHGVIQPISVRKVADSGDVRYEIVAGERRFRASRLAGKEHIPALLVGEQDNVAVALVENLQREDLNPLEEALGIQHLIETEGLSQGSVAERIGRSRTAVNKTLGILSLHEDIRREVLEGADVPRSLLLELVGLPPAEQLALWREIRGGATVRTLREMKQRKPPAPSSPASYIQDAVRRIGRLPARLEKQPAAERNEMVAQLKQLRDTIDDALRSLA